MARKKINKIVPRTLPGILKDLRTPKPSFSSAVLSAENSIHAEIARNIEIPQQKREMLNFNKEYSEVLGLVSAIASMIRGIAGNDVRDIQEARELFELAYMIHNIENLGTERNKEHRHFKGESDYFIKCLENKEIVPELHSAIKELSDICLVIDKKTSIDINTPLNQEYSQVMVVLSKIVSCMRLRVRFLRDRQKDVHRMLDLIDELERLSVNYQYFIEHIIYRLAQADERSKQEVTSHDDITLTGILNKVIPAYLSMLEKTPPAAFSFEKEKIPLDNALLTDIINGIDNFLDIKFWTTNIKQH